MLGNIAKKSTTNDLKMIIRLIKGDLRMNAGTVCFLVDIHIRELLTFEIIRFNHFHKHYRGQTCP